MEPFFCAATGKILPGKHGQQDLICRPRNTPSERLKPYKIAIF
jgi:hypothetical protein